MGIKPRNNIVALAQDYADAKERAAVARKELIAALTEEQAGATPAPVNGAPARVHAPYRSQDDWHQLRTAMLRAMRRGKQYTGAELLQFAPAGASPGQVVRKMRDPLLADGKIVKVNTAGKAWRKGMSPRDVRWVKA